MDTPAWHTIDAGSSLRRYQERAVNELLGVLAEPGSRVCLVAPAGAGKTRCAIHVAAALALPVEVRVPTTALVHQWRQRLQDQLVPVADGPPAPVNVDTYAGGDGLPDEALLILDEAHHLGAEWGRRLESSLGPSTRILGLTATPPEGSPGWDRFLSLVGTRPVEVAAPPLVRDGHLSPFLDLVWPVIADLDDMPELRAAHDAIRGVELTLHDELGAWIARALREDLERLTEDRYAHQGELLVALCRVRHSAGGELPLDLPPDPDLIAPPSLHDRVRVLWAFDPDREAIRQAIRSAGFRRAGKGLVLRDDVAYRSLAASRSRVRGLLDVLALESRVRTDWLRALVLTDRDVEGNRLSARQVLRALVACEDTDVLDPILVTGRAFWVDDDLWPRLEARLPDLPWRHCGDHREADVSSWSTAERVALATRMLSEGTTRCLVGTRHLLGEGWDCPAVNCVVDLTGIVAPVTVNQVRGRALRTDPADPGKVASLWEVLPVLPGVDGGERMLRAMARRHAHTLGLDGQGRIRAGVDRIDRALLGTAAQVAADANGLRARMAARLEAKEEVTARWSVGAGYVDRRTWRIDGRSGGRDKCRVRTPPDPGRTVQAHAGAQVPRKRRRGLAALLLAGAGAGLTTTTVIVGLSPFLLCGAAALMSASMWFAVARMRGLDPQDAAARALDAAMRENGQLHGPLRREGTTWWIDGDPDESRRFAEALSELMGPVRYPRYLLLEPDGGVWPVPTAVGGDRGTTDRFATAWATHVGPCEAIYARQGRGRALLKEAWRSTSRGDVDVVEIWE